MKATTRIEVAVDALGRTVLHRAACEAPLLVRDGGLHDGVLQLWLVGGAAGPLGGDDLHLELHVGAGAAVVVRSVAAQLVQPGPHGRPSCLTTVADVADGARLDWGPEPTISVTGSDHHATTLLRAHRGASVRWTDQAVLGRDGQPPGRLAVHQRVEVDGRVVLDHETVFADGPRRGAGGHGPGRYAATTVLLGDDAPTKPSTTVDETLVHAVLPVAPGCALVTCTSTLAANVPAWRRSAASVGG